jgi:UDP:flavonoid glycosyltransferase YjiC (YdhE family)
VIDLGQLSPEEVWTAVWEVLQDPAYRQNVAGMQSEMHSLPEITQVVVRVEQFEAAHESVRQFSQTDRQITI